MLKALLWKEWHEQRWRVALATVWLLGMTAIGLKTRILPDETIIGMIWTPTAVILPVFLGMGLFAAERRNGTMPYLMVHPVSRSCILAAKVIMGLLSYLVPMVVCGVVICLTVGGRELPSGCLASAVGVLTAFGVIVFVWQLLVGLRCRREETYILASAIVLGGCVVYGYVIEDWILDRGLEPWLLAVNPFTVMDLVMISFGYWRDYDIWPVMIMQSLTLTGLGFGLWFRFRRLREGRS